MQQINAASWRMFYVILSGITNNTHGDFVRMIKSLGHTEVTDPEDCDYCLLFCPITSRVGTDVDLSLRKIPANKPTILVVMYHTFDRDHIVPDSRRLTEDPRVHLAVSCLFYEQNLLSSNCNDTAKYEIRKFLGLTQRPSSIRRSSWRMFYVILSGITNNTHGDFVRMIKSLGHTEVTDPEACDYCLLFCPITSRVGTDVHLSLRKIPANKPTILVVMYHTFDRNHIVHDSRRLTEDPRVHLAVSCLFYEQNLLSSNCNDTAKYEIRKFLGLPQITLPIIRCNNKHLLWIIIGVGLLVVLIILLIVFLTRNQQDGEQ